MTSLTERETVEVNGGVIIPIIALALTAIGVGVSALANADKIAAFAHGISDGYSGK